jgi:hypothetical protein
MFQPSKYLSTCQDNARNMVPIEQEKLMYIKKLITQSYKM